MEIALRSNRTNRSLAGKQSARVNKQVCINNNKDFIQRRCLLDICRKALKQTNTRRNITKKYKENTNNITHNITNNITNNFTKKYSTGYMYMAHTIWYHEFIFELRFEDTISFNISYFPFIFI